MAMFLFLRAHAPFWVSLLLVEKEPKLAAELHFPAPEPELVSNKILAPLWTTLTSHDSVLKGGVHYATSQYRWYSRKLRRRTC